jgi:tRNA(adenine34) deaminase
MCAGAIINARIPQVFYGASDPKAGSVGSVVDLFSLPYNHRPQVVSGVLEAPCALLLQNFFRELRQRRKSAATAKAATEMIDKSAFSGYDK